MTVFAAVPIWLSHWMTPIWLLGIGGLLALLILVALWGILFLVSRKAALAVPSALSEGPILPIFLTIVGLAIFGVLGSLLVNQRSSLVSSMMRLPAAVDQTRRIKVAAATENAPKRLRLFFRVEELREFQVEASESVRIGTVADPSQEECGEISVAAGEPYVWKYGARPFPLSAEELSALYVGNLGDTETEVSISLVTAPLFPQVGILFPTALLFVTVVILYLLQHALLPKISAVAVSTAKSEMAQPLFLIVVGLGAALLFLFVFIPYNTFGEDIKMLKDSGLSLILVFSVIQAVWAASNSVAEEIEGRTALTVLSKPIGRRQFILGKFLGIVWTVALVIIVLSLFFLILVSYKPIYDARETADVDPTWLMCFEAMSATVPGLVLVFFEVVVMAALSVAISTRLPILANFVICFTIYVLGHITPLLVQSSVADFEPVVFIGQLIATVLPVLDHFNIQPAIAAGREVPISYLGASMVYCLLYSCIAMLLALILFEDRDLA